MGVIDKLAKKLGFVRPGRYGLVHTPDDRILSMRPTVLDDGIGGKIVGWLESDLAAMELDRWGQPKHAAPKKIELPKFQELPKPAQVVALVAPEPVAEDDDWEWEIAVARARAEALDSPPPPRPAPVIPVPALPQARSVKPPIAPPARFPRATGRVEDTIRTLAAPPANDDRTQPSIVLPPSASTWGTRAVAAKQR
jgi:hypothetical protein